MGSMGKVDDNWCVVNGRAGDTVEELRARVAELEREVDRQRFTIRRSGDALARQRARIDDAIAERDDWRACAQSATPGGSEYTDPAAVSAHIRRLKDDLHAAQGAVVTAKGERDEARRLAARYYREFQRCVPGDYPLPALPWESGE